MEQERDDQVIYFKDLIFASLYQWRRIILAALIMAILFGAFSIVKYSFNNDASSQDVVDQENVALKKQAVADFDSQILNQETYLKESILMSLDAFQIYRSVVTVYVDSNYQIVTDAPYQEPDRTASILRTYQALLYSTEMLSEVSDILDVPARYLLELLQFDNTNVAAGMLTITVSYTDAEGAEQIAQNIADCLEQLYSQVEDIVQSHELNVLTLNTGVQSDTSILDKQNVATQRLTDLQASRKIAQAELNALIVPSAEQSLTQDPILFSIVGAVIGAFAIVCWACVSHMASGKVYSDRVLQNRTGVKILATVPSAGKKNPIDQWIRAMENRATSPEQITVTAKAIQNYCASFKLLLIAGDSDPQSREPLISALSELGIALCDCGSLNTNAEALEKLPACDAVLLVDQCGKSKYADVAKSIRRVTDQNKQLLGCVLLDG